MIFDTEPRRVCALIEGSSETSVDWTRYSIIMDFGGRCGGHLQHTAVTHAQCITIAGTAGRVEVEIPFTAPPDRYRAASSSRIPPGAVPDRHTIEFETAINTRFRATAGSGDEGDSCAVSARGLVAQE
jgi:hypothetical protein